MPIELEKTGTRGIYRRHTKECGGRSRRCSCPYVVTWRHRGRQHKETFRTLAEARESKGNRDAGDRRPSAKVGFADYFEEWIETNAGRTARGLSETTRPEYRRPLERYAVPRWGSWRLADVEPADLRELLGEMRRNQVTSSAMKKLRAALSAMFATAVEDGYLRANPVQGLRVPTGAGAHDDEKEEADLPAKALTRAELARVLNNLDAQWLLLFEFLTHTGLRISEAIGLTWEHVELGKQPRVMVRDQVYRGKRRKLKSRHARRDVPLSSGMAQRLAEHRRDTYAGEERPVYPSQAGTPLIPGKVARRVLKPAGVAAGLLRDRVRWEDPDEPESWVTFHTFRHTSASLLFDAGRNVKQVQEWLGHADPAFTLRTYVHLLDDGVGDAEFFDDAVQFEVAGGNAAATEGQVTPIK